jgi:hypothetical protein
VTDAAPRTIKCSPQLCASVEPGVRGDPIPALENDGLPLVKRLVGRSQERMAQANRSFHPALVGVRPTAGEKIHERLQQRPLNWRTVPVKNADNSTQSVTLPSMGRALISRGLFVRTISQTTSSRTGW